MITKLKGDRKNRALIANDDYLVKHYLDVVVGIHSRKQIHPINKKESSKLQESISNWTTSF